VSEPFVIDPNRPELYELAVGGTVRRPGRDCETRYVQVESIILGYGGFIVRGSGEGWHVDGAGKVSWALDPLVRLRQPVAAPAPDTTTIARQHWEDCCAQGKHLHGYYAEAAIDEPAKAIETVAMFDADHPASKLLLLPADEFIATALRWRDQLVMDMNDLADDWMLTQPDPDEPTDVGDADEDQGRDAALERSWTK
jgi:hypothetical protein